MLPPDLIKYLAALSDGDAGLLGNIVVTATLDSGSGRLGPVAGVLDKFVAAIENRRVPRINAIAVSNDQTDVLNEPGIRDHTRETESPRLLQSEDFADLVEQLAGLRRGRTGIEPYDYHGTLAKNYRRENFVGRQSLFERIARDLEEKDRGFIVLAAGPGFGKTAFVLEFIERYRDKGTDATALGAWHILRKTQATWVPAIAMVEQLEWRLRDRLGCPLDETQANVKVDAGNAAAILQGALCKAAAKLGPEQRLLLVVDGIDEAFGANTPAGLEQHDLLRQIFPGPRDLPAGIFVLFASRPGAHLLGWLNDEADIIDVDHGDASLQAANRADLAGYLKRELMAVADLGGYAKVQTLSLAERMTDACEGGFYVAEWFARKAKDPGRFKRWLAGEALPRGIDATLEEDWKHKADGLGKTERALLPVLASAIAIWHEAGTPVTRDVIADLFEAARDSTLPVGEMDASAITRTATTVCLKKLRDWFDGVADDKPPLYTFRHSRIPELLLDEIVDVRTRREVHRLLAWTSARWPDLKRESRRAALANAPWHHALAEDLDGAMKLLADPCKPYLATVYAELDTAVSVLVRNYAAAIQVAATEDEDKRSTTKSTSREPRPLMHLRDLWRVLSQYGDSLRQPERPLAPTLYNHLAAAWDPQSEAHRNLVQAAEDYSGEWLQRMNPEPPDRRLIAVLRPHLADVRCLAWSPDGTRLASGSEDNSVRLWDGHTGAPLGAALTGHTRRVLCLAWSPDGKALASGSDDGSVCLWDGQTGVPLGAPLTGHTSDVTCVAWSPPAGSRLASGSVDKTLRLWDGQTGASVCEPLTGHAGIVRCLAWSPDGNRLVSASNEDVRLWDGHTGASAGKSPITHIDEFVWEICLAWSPDGKVLASASADGGLRLWDGQTGASVGEPLTGHGGIMLCLAWSRDGNVLAGGSVDGSVQLWDGQAGTPLGAPLTGHGILVECVAWSPDGTRLASGSFDRSVCLWGTQSGTTLGEPLTGHGDIVNCLAWSPDGRRLASGSRDRSVRLWDVQAEALHIERLTGQIPEARCLALTPDGTRLASGSPTGSVQLWNGQTGVPLGGPSTGHTAQVRCLAWSPDGRRLASGSADGSLRLWDGQTGAPLGGPLSGHDGKVTCLAWSPDRKRLASGSTDSSLRLWDGQTGVPLGGPLSGHDGKVTCIAWSPDGRRLASGSTDSNLRLWDGQTGAPLGGPLNGHVGKVICIAWSPDGKRLARSGIRDDSLRLWIGQIEAPLGEPLTDQRDLLYYLPLSVERPRAASASHNQRLSPLKGQAGAPVIKLMLGLASEVRSLARCLAWSKDGKQLASGSDDGHLRFWDATDAMCTNEVDVQMAIEDLQIVGDVFLALGRLFDRPRVVGYRLKRPLTTGS